MRYAIFSDIHANLRAWEQVLADISEQRADVLVCLGDVVGYGPKPEEVLHAIRGVTDNFVMGNHDAAAAGAIDTSYFNEHARGAIEWTIAALSEEARDFLASVPLAIETENILFVHAEICEPGRFGYIEEVADAHENFASSDHFVTFVGHTHYPCVFELSSDGSVVEHPDANRQLHAENRYIVNVGSVGEPRNPDDLRGRYVIYDSETREVEFRGVTFDISAYRTDLESTTLSIKPYFLQVFDHLLGEIDLPVEEAARAIDMEIGDDVAPLIEKRRGPAKLNIPTTPMAVGEHRSHADPKLEEESKSNKTVLFVALVATLALVIALVAFMMAGGETKTNTVIGDDPLVTTQTPETQVEPVLPETIVKPPTPEPQLRPEPPKPPPAVVVAEPLGPVVSIDFNLSAAANQSGTPLNVDGLTLDGQEGAWGDLQVGAEPDTDTNKELKIDTGEGVFTFNPGGAGSYRVFAGGGDELRQDGVLLNAEAAGPIEWSLSGLTPTAGYDMILFAQADNGVRGNPVDFTVVGYDDGNPVALDSDNDGNFTKVIANAKGEIYGFFALRSGETHSGWSGLQFRKTSEPTVVTAPPTPKPPPPAAAGADIVFDDFEKPDYAGWQVTGEAFGKGPVAIAEIPAYQGDVNGIGNRVVNSHASAPGDQLGKDRASGSLLSRLFEIERKFITLRIGGGQHPSVHQAAGTGVHLIVDGKAVRSLTGHNNNRMRSAAIDVTALRGKTAQLMIVDAVSGGWGNIGVDQIVFTDTATTAPEPVPASPNQPSDPTIAWWRMEADSADGALVDAKGNHRLSTAASGSAIGGLAPSPIPFNKIENSAALGIGVWAEPAPADVFALRADRSFTIEGWVLTARQRGPVFVAGTRSGDANDSQGWHVDIRPPSNPFPNGQMAFFYDNGPAFVQALSEDLSVADLKPHHFAAVWDHDASAAAGEMRLYFDGDQVATTPVPHERIPTSQANPFRIGSPTNPPKIGLDEVRFSGTALSPLEFLRAEPQRMAKNGKWADAAIWSGGEPPSGTQTAVIGPGVGGRVETPTEFAGDLVLESNATLTLATPQSIAVLPAPPSKLVLNQGSQLILLTPNNPSGNADFQRVELAGTGVIWGGRSTTGHHTKRVLTGEVSGPGALVLDGVNNNEFVLQSANTYRGGFVAKSTQNQGFRVRANAAGCFSAGEVKIDPNATLILDVEGATTERNVLRLNGPKDARAATKLIINANTTVAEFHLNGAKQAAGTWGAPGMDVDHEHAEISGGGILTVIR